MIRKKRTGRRTQKGEGKRPMRTYAGKELIYSKLRRDGASKGQGGGYRLATDLG